ncbi:WecB/TagA/CpsF family glycosyltransferase [Mangrovibrevibacter kandeliae]|uniref:WecB/TagA/CpsF family glycosyltransferase n=1 Tax=Mangrovibrevibacter kandeliae TaxID=2968473 RepID=UPI002117E444|nr:WecB/TagA/CpsF family glycosyltransferase [Aurantimonas sp. CSK15Z-1]MCQ8783622.1 WecB/TagA/CpsF family glycosyltransferase [Aurantimonas sp. CSK15Z-1]
MLAVSPPVPDIAALALPRRAILGVDVLAIDGAAARALLAQRLEARAFTRVAFLNAHCANLAAERVDYRGALAQFVVLPDGIGVDIAAQMLFGARFPENLNGTDFVPALLAGIGRPLRIGLLGGEPGIVERAASNFAARLPQHRFLPVADGFFAPGEETDTVLAALEAAELDVLLVGLGVPRQELFVARHLDRRHAALVLSIGALLDFTAGKVSRAPEMVRRARMEWVWRLGMEPKRMWRRYVLGNPRFLGRVAAEKLRRTRRA